MRKLDKNNIKDILDLTPLQKGILFHYLQAPQDGFYFNQLSLELSGDINLQHFEEAWNFVIESNEMLRTVFRWEKLDSPSQVVLKRHSLHLRFEDLSGIGDSVEQKKQWDALKQQDRSFDLREVPFRILLTKMSPYRFQMLISNHHILYDGWSTGIILKEFLLAYEALAGGNLPLVPRAKSGFKEFIRWLQKQDRQEQKKYWQNCLEGFDTPSRFPIKPSNLEPALPGKSSYRLRLSKAVKDKLDSLVRGCQPLTLAAVFYGAWALLLQKYCGSEDVVFGITVSGRSAPIRGIEDLVGLFINTIPLRVRSEPGDTLTDFLVRINNRLAAGEKYENTPLVDIYNCGRPLSQGGEELFDSLVSMENYPLDAFLKMPGPHLSIRSYEMEERPHYDLNLVISAAEEIDIDFIYNNTCFDKESIVGLAHHFSTLLNGFVENSQGSPQDIEMLPGEEKHRLLVDFNRTDADFPREKAIHELFEEQVRKRPYQVALVGSKAEAKKRRGEEEKQEEMPFGQINACGGKEVRPVQPVQLTYHELNERSNRLAGWLIEKGVHPDTIVGIMMERSVDMIIGILGILKSGGAYLPIDPEYPQERIDYMLKDSGAKILLTDMGKMGTGKMGTGQNNNFNCQLPIVNCQLLMSAGEGTGQCLVPKNPFIGSPRRGPTGTSLAYVIYTSGSTGKPKGVMVQHRSLVNLCCWHNTFFSVTPRDRAAKYASSGFDASVWEIFPYLVTGASIYMVPGEIILEIETLNRYFEDNDITINFLPTQVCEQFMTLNNTSLRVLLTGGDKLKNYIKRNYRLYNNYGPTENTVVTTSFWVTEASGNIPIGKPISNNRIYILDGNHHLQPIGVPGELYVGGDSLALGYLNNPELTCEKFLEVSEPFFKKVLTRRRQNLYRTGDPPAGGAYKSNILYRTGDLARWLPDPAAPGAYLIEFLGRIDYQVKIRGFRIELGEIENRLLKHHHIKDAVVIDRIDEKGDKYLVAYLVTGEPIETARLRDFLSKSLPAYMIPFYFISLEAIPLTLTGKIDKKALPGLVFESREKSPAPRNEVERKLAAVWEKVLGREKIGIDENFFLIGGDSIKVIQIASRMRREGYKLEIKDIFRNPTIARLSPWVIPVKRELEQGVVTGRIPLTPIQREFFESDKIAPHHFNQAVMLKIKEGIDKKTLEILVQKIQEHHDALRMNYRIEGTEILQTGNDTDYPIGIEEHDLRGKAVPKEAMESICNEIQAGIDLREGPLMKIGLFHLEDGDRVLIVIHHLVVDGVSWRILFEDFDTLYRQNRRGEKLELPLKTGSFKEWSEKLADYSDSEAFLLEKSYWRAQESREVEEIERDIKEGERNDVRDAVMVSFNISEEETGLLLGKVNQAFGTEINDILLTALGLGLKKSFNKGKYAIDLEGHGREELFKNVEIGRTVGWFTSVYPVVLDMSYADDPGRQVKEIKENLRKIPHKGIGYGILKYLSSAENKKDIGFKLRPFISFNYLGQFGADVRDLSFEISDEPVGHTQSLDRRRDHELDIIGIVVDKQMRMDIIYNREHWKEETITGLMENLKSGLCRLIEYCSCRERREYTPSDFTYKGLPKDVVDKLCNRYPIEDLYTLSPMQEGMLFHSLMDEQSESYFEQISYRLHTGLETDVFKKSLDLLSRRHDILRTVFIYNEIDRPVQVVLKEGRIDFYYEKFGPIEGEEANAAFLKEFKTRDRRKTFDLSFNVPMRVSVLELGNKEYEVIWSSHHILMDGWCIGILNKEFFEIYRGIKEDRRIELPVVRPYRDYICWLEQRDRGAAQKYWNDYLEDYEERSGIPRLLSDEMKDKGSYREENVEFVLGTGEIERLKKIGEARGVTLNIIMQGVWGILLGRYTGKEDVVFGSVVSGRPPEIEGIETMVGLFINTVPVRVRYRGDMEFGELLEKLQGEALESEPHHYYPLAEIQAGSLLKQDLIDHIYVFENYPIVEQIEGYETAGRKGRYGVEASGPRLSHVEVFEQTNYDFNVVLGGSDRLTIKLAYNGNVFAREFVKRIGGHFRRIVSQVIERDEKKINEIDILTEEEREQILYRFNDTREDYPRTGTLHELFEEQVERRPHQVAVYGQGAFLKNRPLDPQKTFYYLTYHELNERSDGLAGLLKERGVRPDTIVGLMMERSVEMIIGILGILKSGGAYLPIDPGYPPERIDYMLKDSNAKLVVNEKFFGGSRAPRRAEPIKMVRCVDKAITMENLPSLIGTPCHGGRRLIKPPKEAKQSYLAYVIYTSGTTGKPKGVLVEHRNAVNVVNWNIDMHKMGNSVYILLVSDYTFDASVAQAFGSLISGAILHIAEKEIRPDTEKLQQYILDHTINLIDLVPTHLKELLCYTDKLKSLHTVVSGGEKLDDATKEIIIEKGYRLVNQYGPTETTIDALALECSPGKVSMGKPISNVKVYILDRYEKVLPLGVVGELYIAGAGVTRGYLNRPELTAEKFCLRRPGGSFEKPPPGPPQNFLLRHHSTIHHSLFTFHPSPFTTHHSPFTIYKTGDLVRWQEDPAARGTYSIEFIGRIDHQVKIRGFRIELGEIENQLLTHNQVKEAIVIAREDHNQDNYLCAYIVAKPGETDPIDSAGLREYLSQRLPGYMVPAYFVQLENIPLASSGKIDRKALPEPGLKAGENYLAPRNETEEKLTAIWSDILDIEKEKIGIHDNFFHLGGHSLKATLLTSRIHKELKVSVPLSEIFKTPHIRGLAALVMNAAKNRYEKIQAVETREYYPVFSAQERVYLSHQVDKSKVGYNLIYAIPLGEKIEIGRLESSLKKLVDRHESLRTSFELVKGQLVQKVHRGLSFKILHLRLNQGMETPGVLSSRPEEVVVDLMRPFDLSEPPLFRVGLVETAKGEYILAIGIHHIITDGRSLEILTEEFLSLYTGKELYPLRLQFKDFSNWHNSPRQKIAIKEQEAFWTGQFKDKITLLNLPTDFERPTVLTSEGDIVNFHLDLQITGELGKIRIETETTMFMVLIAIYSVFLAKIAHQEDILVGIPVAGRRHADLRQITGMFVNTLVMRSQPANDKSFREFLNQVKKYSLAAFENQEYQFENLLELVAKKRDASRNPVFDTMFSYQEIDKKEKEDIEAVIGQYDYKYKTSLFDLSLAIVDQKDTLTCTFHYNTNLFKRSTVIRWIRYFRETVDAIVNRPGIKLGEIDILSEEDKQRILEKIDETGEKYRQDKTGAGSFGEPAAKTPQGVAHQEEEPGKGKNRVEPATEKEQQILAMWEKIVGQEIPGVTADFFQSGGNSIGALLLVTEINKTFNRKLSITDIYENESIRKQAALVERTPGPGQGEKTAKDKNIFRLKVGSRGGKNIFLIHDATGEVDKYRLFCKELKTRDNYWGLPLKSGAVGGMAPQELEIESLASGYIEVIKQVQARGPYNLGGWSIGGIIAFEMARQLEQAGENADRLYMFDTAVPVKNTPTQSFDLPGELEFINRYFQVPVTILDGIKATNPEELWQEFLNFIEKDETYNRGYIVEKLAEYSELINDFDKLPAAELFKYVNRFRSTANAGSKYYPAAKIKAKLHYYQAELSDQEAAKWQEFFIDKIDLYQTRGNHFSMLNGSNLRYLIGIFQG